MTAGAPIRVDSLVKRYKDVTALAGVSFEVNRGEIFGLLGPNGAGKTTALHLLLGVLTPTEGSISVLGHSPQKDRYKIYPRINFSSAYVQMPFNIRARQNLEIFAKLYGIPKPAAKIDSLLTTFQLTDRAENRTGSLSSGEQTGKDIAELVRESLKKMQKETRLTIIYTSHNMAEVEDLCDRVLFIHRGKKIVEGTPAQVRDTFQKESLEKVFIHLARTGEVEDRAANK